MLLLLFVAIIIREKNYMNSRRFIYRDTIFWTTE